MESLIVDANVLFSALIRPGKPWQFFRRNKTFERYELIAPEFLFFETGRRIDKILSFTHFNREEFIEVFSFIKGEIELIPLETFEDKTQEAKSIAPHLKDVSYIALSLKIDCKIISGDQGVKNALPNKVLTPSEALDSLPPRKEP